MTRLRTDSNFLRHRLGGEDTTASRPVRVRLTKNRTALAIMSSQKQLGKIDNRHTHHAIEPLDHFRDAQVELFPKQILAHVVPDWFAARLCKTRDTNGRGNREAAKSHM